MNSKKRAVISCISALIFGGLSITAIFVFALRGYALIAALAIAAMFGVIAWTSFVAGLSPKPGESIASGVIKIIIEFFFGWI